MHSVCSLRSYIILRRSYRYLVLLLACTMMARALPPSSGSAPAPVRFPQAPAPHVLTSVAQIRALSQAQADRALPIELHAIVTYYRVAEDQVFVQDATGGIFVLTPPSPPLLRAGDQVLIRGTTFPGFATNIMATEMRLEGKPGLPQPVAADYEQMMGSTLDCRVVRLRGTVRSAYLQTPPAAGTDQQPEHPYLLIDLLMDGGYVHVRMDGVQGLEPLSLLDAQVEVTGVAGGFFDGKMRPIGAELWVADAKQLRVLKPARRDPANLPLTPVERVLSAYRLQDRNRRVRVEGSVTLYQPGLRLVLQNAQGQAILVHSFDQSPLRLGQIVDAIGFPDPSGYSEALNRAYLLPTNGMHTIEPVSVDWDDALRGRHPYEIVSMEGTLAAEVHERHQDTLIIQTGSHVFSAILPRTIWNTDLDGAPLPDHPLGSRVRVTGVCFVQAGGPWNTERWFELQMRSPEDVTILAAAPWWTVRHLLYLSAALLALMLAALIWAAVLQKKVRRQTEQIRLGAEAEADRERRIAHLEKERGRVLEAINSVGDLDEVLLAILNLIRTRLPGSACWYELADGTRIGEPAPQDTTTLLVRHDILSGAGEPVGSLVITGAESWHSSDRETLELGASLAALAIDKRRLYDTLLHRSQYDQLTNAANRFLLESRLDETLLCARQNNTRFALIYIDLDDFKRVNDLYGHRVGDILLQQVTERFSEKLRGMDTLARVGGDEFIALIPAARSRAEVEEIAQRLLCAFDKPFLIDGHSIPAWASVGIALYPEDGLTKEELKRVADTAMYACKPSMAD